MYESILIDREGKDVYMRCIPRGFESQVVLSEDAMTASTITETTWPFSWQSFFLRRAISRCYQCHHIIWNKTSYRINLVYSKSSRIACYGPRSQCAHARLFLEFPASVCQWRHIDRLITKVLRSQLPIDQSQSVLKLRLGFDPWWWRGPDNLRES